MLGLLVGAIFLVSPILAAENQLPDDLSAPLRIPLKVSATAVAGDFPYIADVRSVAGTHLCSGVFISSKEIVTLAYCVKDAIADRKVGVNAFYNGQQASVCRIDYFRGFDSSKCPREELAVLQLASSAGRGKAIGGLDSGSVLNGDNKRDLTALGWFSDCVGECGLCGAASPALESQEVKLDSEQTCRTFFGDALSGNVFCARADISTLCSWDLGQALIARNSKGDTLIGLGSFGKAPQSGCNVPTAFVRIDRFKDWIQRRKKWKYKNVTKTVKLC